MAGQEPHVKSGKRIRVGRGFSTKELDQAGLSVQEARRNGIRVDVRRKTAHDGNVSALKSRKS